MKWRSGVGMEDEAGLNLMFLNSYFFNFFFPYTFVLLVAVCVLVNYLQLSSFCVLDKYLLYLFFFLTP